MKQYLVLAYDDDFEITKPCCLTNDISTYGYGYEIWEWNEDGTFTKFKDVETSNKTGMIVAVYNMDTDELLYTTNKIQAVNRKQFNTAEKIKEIVKLCGFTDKPEIIAHEIAACGDHGELVGGKWVVFGEYQDSHYPRCY